MGLFKRQQSEDLESYLQEDWSQVPIPSDPSGPLYGALAEGLALGAPMARDGSWWNSLTGDGPENDHRSQLRTWGIKKSEYWIDVLNALLGADYGDTAAYFAAELRTRAKAHGGFAVLTDDQWHFAIDDWLRTNSDSVSPEAGPPLHESIAGIRSAEDLMRTARLLEPEEEVIALDAYDIARAVAVARWGVSAQFGPAEVAAKAAVAARDIAAAGYYRDWRDFGLGFIAGRIVTYPDTWGKKLTEALAMIRPLLDNPESPWRNINFPVPRDDDEQ